MKNLFDEAMNGIGEKVALQEIRKVLRGKLPEKDKLEAVVEIIHTYEDYAYRTQRDAENRELEKEESEMRREQWEESMKKITEPLTIRKGDGK